MLSKDEKRIIFDPNEDDVKLGELKADDLLEILDEFRKNKNSKASLSDPKVINAIYSLGFLRGYAETFTD